MIPQRIHCDITGVEHLIVTPDQYVHELIEWSLKKVIELNSGKKIYISIDCEGLHLGFLPNSLRLVQFAECYDEHTFDPDAERPLSIKLKPGFMVLYPTIPIVTDCLSAVFSHPNVRLVTFDFTGDFCTMMEAGIKLNVLDTLDCKFYGWNGKGKVTIGLKGVCKQGDMCVEYEKCKDAIEKKHKIPFDKICYEGKDDPDPFQRFLDQEFWKYSSHDIALTALAGIACITKCDINKTYAFSRKAAEDMLQQQEKSDVLAPSLAHQLSYKLPFINAIGHTSKMKFAYSNYCTAYCIYHSWDLIDHATKRKIKKSKNYFLKCMRNANTFLTKSNKSRR